MDRVVMRNLVLLFVVCIGLISCNKGVVFDDVVSMPKSGWSDDSLAVFRVDISESTKNYDMWIQVRNDNTYAYANLWLFIDVISASDGVMVRDTLDCVLAHPNGEWLGGGWGSLYTVDCPYRLNTKFATEGKYTCRISHGMRDESIIGIKSIGLRIKENNGEE